MRRTRRNFFLRYAAIHRLTAAQAEDEVSLVILEVAANLAPHFAFGIHSEADITQQAALIALQALYGAKATYNPERPLRNFLYVHLKNRLKNFKRDNLVRSEPPCKCCDPFGVPDKPCARWLTWQRLNTAKRGLAQPMGSDCLPEEYEDPGVAEEASVLELEDRVRRLLSPALRSDYLRLRHGVSLSQVRLEAVRKAVADILQAAPAREGEV